MELLKATLVQRVRIFKALCIATRINKSMCLPPIPLLFSQFESNGCNAVFSPGGLAGLMAGLSIEPAIYIDIRFLEKEHFGKVEAVLAHELRHWYQFTQSFEDFVSDGQLVLADELAMEPHRVEWHSWHECDARAYANWWMTRRKEGMAYAAPTKDGMLEAYAGGDKERFVHYLLERYETSPKLEVEWFGNQPTYDI